MHGFIKNSIIVGAIKKEVSVEPVAAMSLCMFYQLSYITQALMHTRRQS